MNNTEKLELLEEMFSKANESDNSFVYSAGDILEFKNKNGWKN